MSIFALVRGSADLARACEELGDFFSFRRRQRDQAPLAETLLGIWIEPRMAVEVPCVLTLRDQSAAGRPVQIRETTGLSGIWTMCWLETPGGEDRNEVSRQDLLGALIESSGFGQEGVPSGRFIPVFRSDAAPSEAQTEMRSLRKWYPHHMIAPLYQDPVTGRLSLPDERDG